MKTLLAILCLTLAAILCLTLAACEGPVVADKAIPAVKNRRANGQYMVPECPLCGGQSVLSCTTYRCAKGHKYESADDEISVKHEPTKP